MGRRSDFALVEDMVRYFNTVKTKEKITQNDFCQKLGINSATARKWLGIFEFIKKNSPELMFKEEKRSFHISLDKTAEKTIDHEQNGLESILKGFDIQDDQILSPYLQANMFRVLVRAYNEVGECYLKVGKSQVALHHFKRAKALANEHGDSFWIAKAQVNLAKTLNKFILLGDKSKASKARSYLLKAKQIYTELEDNQGLMSVNGLFGDLEASLGDLEAALTYYEFAAKSAEALDDENIQEDFLLKAKAINAESLRV